MTYFDCFSTNLELSKATITTSENFTVTVTVHNTGSVDGKEVVQVSDLNILTDSTLISQLINPVKIYATDLVSSVVTPNQFLVGFQKVDIPYVRQLSIITLQLRHFLIRAGGSQTVTIQVLSEQLAVWNLENQWSVEPGQFQIKIGNSAETYAQTVLTVAS